MQSAGSVLKRMVPELVVSKQKLRQAEGSCIVRLKREEGKQNLGFSSRPFVLCGLPVRKPPKGELLYERRNGNFVLQITGHPNYGFRSVKTGSFRFTLARSQFGSRARQFAFEPLRKCWRPLACTKAGKNTGGWSLRSNESSARRSSSGRTRSMVEPKWSSAPASAFFVRPRSGTAEIPDQCPLSDQFENVIVLSDEFYREITAHPIPADLEAVKVLAGAPAVLDLFMWLSIVVSWQRARRRFRCSDLSGSRAKSGRWNMHGRGGFAKSSTNG